MAEDLKQTHDVMLLKVEVAPTVRRSEGLSFTWTLQGEADDKLVDLASARVDNACDAAVALMRGDGLDERDPQINLPGGFVESLHDAVHRFADESRPLWVQLVKPYGALRMVPWERLLVPVLNRPVLMLPDFLFPQRREALVTLEVAVCASAPLGCEDDFVRKALKVVVQALLKAPPQTVRVHLFCDAALVDEQRTCWESNAACVTVHDPQDAEPFVAPEIDERLVDSTGLLRSPWLLWMRKALVDRAVDVVHFVGHTMLARGGHGAFLFAQSPLERTERYLAGPVGATELQTFLTQVGAWSTAFTAIPDNHSPPGLRALADAIAQSRPGPLLMHDLSRDFDGQALAAALEFLYSEQPAPAPRSDALFLYCQPFLSLPQLVSTSPGDLFGYPPARVAAHVQPGGMRDLLRVDQVVEQVASSALKRALDRVEALPPWLAATRNFVEAQQLQLQSLTRDRTLPEAMLRERSEQLQLTLQRLGDAAAALACERGLLKHRSNKKGGGEQSEVVLRQQYGETLRQQSDEIPQLKHMQHDDSGG